MGGGGLDWALANISVARKSANQTFFPFIVFCSLHSIEHVSSSR